MTHPHIYTEMLLDGHGGAVACRECTCGVKETLLYDFGQHRLIWTLGQFFDIFPMVFVFTANQFDAVKNLLESENGGLVCFDMNRPDAWETMEIYHLPNIFLADDWKECPVVDDYRFKTLVTTGHTYTCL